MGQKISTPRQALALTQEEPYFLARRRNGALSVEGAARGFLGHKVDTPGCPGQDGVFVEWEWDGQTLRVTTDVSGMYPFYYCAWDNSIAISPSIPRLLALGTPQDLDIAALAVFFRLGNFIGEDTPFTSIRALPPNATLVWRENHLTVTGGRSLGTATTLSRSAALDGYVELFRDAVRRRIPADRQVAVTLSGGRDSRHILLELCEAGCPPTVCVTVGEYLYNHSNEADIAQQLAALVGVPHVILSQTDTPFQLELEKNLLTNFCSDEHAWFFSVARYLRDKTRAVYDGLGGSLFCDGFALTPERLTMCRQGKFRELGEELLGSEHIMPFLKPSERQRWSRDLAMNRLLQELEQHATSPNPVSSFYYWNRTRREVSLSPYRLLRGFEVVYSPFCDYAVYQHLSSLPASMVMDHTFHNDTISRAFPEAGAIPYAYKPKPRETDGRELARLAQDVLGYCRDTWPSRRLSYSYVVPRLLRSLIDSRYRSAMLWVAPPTIYLLQLEAVMREAKQGSALME
jgi:hypothetical protein